MRSPIKLPHLNARFEVPAGFVLKIAALIAAWSRSAFKGLLAAFLILTMCTAPLASAYGVGETSHPVTPPQGSSSRKTVIEVRTPPGVYLPGPTFSTLVASQKPVTSRVPESLRQSIEQTLLRNDPRLRVATTTADTSIACTITDLAVTPGIETRTRPVYQKTGETTITDPTTGVSRTEDVYGYVDVPYRALVFEGRMSVKCEVTDVATFTTRTGPTH